MKEKIAISLDKRILDLIDSKVDGSTLRSRSQAIEVFLKKGLGEQQVSKAVIMLSSEHQKTSLKMLNGKSLIRNQLDFFHSFGISQIILITPKTKDIEKINLECMDSGQEVNILTINAKGNAQALLQAREHLDDFNFIVISGDTFNDFDLNRMIRRHIETDRLSMMGLMTREKPSEYGTAILDGDSIVDFQEKPKTTTSLIVNAGIYIFKPEVFEVFENAISLERDVFPKLARIKQLTGFFTYGEYFHLG